MNQYDTTVQMLSERVAGSKVKRISITHSKTRSFSAVKLVFESDKNEERVIVVYGKDLGVGFGRQAI